MSNPLEANYRFMRYNGKYLVEVLDKPVGHWYIVANNIPSFEMAVKYCLDHFEPKNNIDNKVKP